jgi:hypothetical protein
VQDGGDGSLKKNNGWDNRGDYPKVIRKIIAVEILVFL